jgi:L-alanine-DL-glutamate epimerase-like enolase superfamily enzyme
VVKLDIRRFNLQLAHPWQIARTSATRNIAIVLVRLSDNNITGFGEASPVARYCESVETVENFCQNIDLKQLSFENLPDSMNYLDELSRVDQSAKCALSIALLDGAGKRARKSIHELFNLSFTENRHVTSFTIGIDEPAMIKKKVLSAETFPILKMKVGVAGDKNNLEALRTAAPTKWIRLDANEGWLTKEQALRMIEDLAQDGRISFVEQPMPEPTPVRDWIWLKERSPLPIFADESYHSAKDAARAAECFHGVNVKLVKTGGIFGAFDALTAARRAGLKTMLGCMIETSILVSAAAHLADLCDYLDLDGNLLVTNDPYAGVTAEKGLLSFAAATEQFGLRVTEKV